MTGQWQKNTGSIPRVVHDGVWVEAKRRDGTIIYGEDFEHADLWKPERHGGGAKDIILWRVK